MERQSERNITSSSPTRSGTVVDAKMTLALWLRAGRSQRGMTIEAVAKVTKIQPRILERLETGKLDGLPADVFVRGFVRSYARCVGLDEDEALKRYSMASGQPQPPSATARAFVESMSELAPNTAYRATPRIVGSEPIAPMFPAGSAQDLPAAVEPPAAIEPAAEIVVASPAPAPMSFDIVVEDAPVAAEIVTAPAEIVDAVASAAHDVVADATPGKKKRGRRGGKGRNKSASIALGTPSSPMPIVAAPVEIAAAAVEVVASAPVAVIASEAATITSEAAAIASEPSVSESAEIAPEPIAPGETWSPRMPVVVAPSVPWRRPHTRAFAAPAPVAPSLVIDDADPDSAERELEDRAASKERRTVGRSFLPPILLDREDRGARQGGLTLAVIILLIAATLTLSYLMRRPSSSGDGVTQVPTAPLTLDHVG